MPIQAVVGSDESEVKRVAAALAADLAPADAGEFGSDIIDGAAENAEQAVTRIHQTIEALLTLPFFGGGKLVWLKSANFFADSIIGRAASVLEAVEKLAALLNAGLSGDVTFLLSAPEIDKRRSFYKTLGKIAKVQVFDRLDSSRAGWETEVAELIRTRARSRGLTFTEEALQLFTLCAGADGRQIENELEKLDLYLGKTRREAAIEDVRLLVPVSRAGVIFELGNALARRNLPLALESIDQLLRQGESAIGILLVAIVPTVRNLLLVKDLMQRHKLSSPRAPFHFQSSLNRLPAAATDHLPRKKDGTVNAYALGIAAASSHLFSISELKRLFESCVQANIQLVTTQLEPRIILNQLLMRLAAA